MSLDDLSEKRKSFFSRRSKGHGKFKLSEDTKCLELASSKESVASLSEPKLLGIKAIPSFRYEKPANISKSLAQPFRIPLVFSSKKTETDSKESKQHRSAESLIPTGKITFSGFRRSIKKSLTSRMVFISANVSEKSDQPGSGIEKMKSPKLLGKLSNFRSKRKKPEEVEVSQPGSSTIREEHGKSLSPQKEGNKKVLCVEPAEVADPDDVIQVAEFPLVRSSSNASSYFVDIPEPIPDSDETHSGNTLSSDDFEDTMEDQVRVLSLPTEEDYAADEENLDHIRQESIEKMKANADVDDRTRHEEVDKARADEGAELLNIPEENRESFQENVFNALDVNPASQNPGSHLGQQAEDEEQQQKYEKEQEENISPSKSKRRNKKKGIDKKEESIKHALSSESFEHSKNQEKRLKLDTAEHPVKGELSDEKGGYEDDIEPPVSLGAEKPTAVKSTRQKKSKKKGKSKSAIKVPPSEPEHIRSESIEEHLLSDKLEKVKEESPEQVLDTGSAEEGSIPKKEFSQELGGYEDDQEFVGEKSNGVGRRKSLHTKEKAPKLDPKTSQRVEKFSAEGYPQKEEMLKESEPSPRNPDPEKLGESFRKTRPFESAPEVTEHVESGTVEGHLLKDEFEKIKEDAQNQMLEAETSLRKSWAQAVKTIPESKPKETSVSRVDVLPKEAEHTEIGTVEEHELKNIMEEVKEEAQRQMKDSEETLREDVKKGDPEHAKVERTDEHQEVQEGPQKQLIDSKETLGKLRSAKSHDGRPLSPTESTNVESSVERGPPEERQARNLFEKVQGDTHPEKAVGPKAKDEETKPQGEGPIGFENLRNEVVSERSQQIGFDTLNGDSGVQLPVEHAKSSVQDESQKPMKEVEPQEVEPSTEMTEPNIDIKRQEERTVGDRESNAEEPAEPTSSEVVSVAEPVDIARSEEKVKEVFDDLRNITEGMELLIDESHHDDLEKGEQDEDVDELKAIAAKMIDEHPEVNPTEVLKAFKQLGEFAEGCVSEVINEVKAEPVIRKQRNDTVESYGLSYDDDFHTDSDEQTADLEQKTPEDREVAAEDSSQRLRKWSTGVRPHVLEDLPEADQPPHWRESEEMTSVSSQSKGELEPEEKPQSVESHRGFARVPLTRTEICPSLLKELHSELVDKVLSIPMVDTGISAAYMLYTSIKGNCPRVLRWWFIEPTEKSTMKSISYAFTVSKWILKPFSRQLYTLDHLAAQGLESLENRLLPHAS